MPSKPASAVRLLVTCLLVDAAVSAHQNVAFAITHTRSCVVAPKLLSRRAPSHRPSRRRGRGSGTSTASFAIPDVSSLVPLSPDAVATKSGILSPQTLAASASATLTYISLLAYFDRPRGSLAIPDPQSSLVVQQSRVPNAGLGLFASQSLSAGTVLGTYAGVVRPAQAFYDGKCRQHPQAVGYSWRFTDNKFVIDPTDSEGEIQDFCLGGSSDVPLSNFVFANLLGFWRANTALCRINEPPIGAGGCNVSAREDLEKREVVFTLIQNVYPGQELYLDYGLDYDRSRYGPSPGSDNGVERS